MGNTVTSPTTTIRSADLSVFTDKGVTTSALSAPAAGPEPGVLLSESSMALVMAEIVRMSSTAEQDLKNVAMEMKAVNDKLQKAGKLEQKLRDCLADGSLDIHEVQQIREMAGTEFGDLGPVLDAVTTHLLNMPGQTHDQYMDYNPYAGDAGLKENARLIDAIKESLSGIKDSLNGTMSELQIKIQLAQSANNQWTQVQSNSISARNQTAMAIIGNLRG